MRRHVLIGAGALAIAALALPLWCPPAPRLMWNASASVPVGLYAVYPARGVRHGDLVLVAPPPPLAQLLARRRYLPLGVPLVKPVAALAGDRVCRSGMQVTINGRLAARALARDRTGRPLAAWRGCRKLGQGELFLLAPAPDSFDSRYFGALPLAAVRGEAVALWTRSGR